MAQREDTKTWTQLAHESGARIARQKSKEKFLESIFTIAGPQKSLHILGVKLVGVNAETATKLALTLVLMAVVFFLSHVLRVLARKLLARREDTKIHFWARQGIQLSLAIVLVVGVLSIWFDDPGRLSTGLGLMTAGLAFALQKVVASLAGYLVILRGKTFNVGDRISMGGVRGDVVALGFMQTTILEMGQPPAVQNADPAMWVKARQYSGRVVTVSNSKIFDEPVYNYSREFPFVWEEMQIPVSFRSDRKKAEEILREAAERHTVQISEMGQEAARALERRYFVTMGDLKPRVFLRITDNWVELTVRFIVRDHEIREVKDAVSREILERFDECGLGIASATFEIVGFPELKIKSGVSFAPAKAS